LYTRLRVVCEPGVDDALIAVAAMFNFVLLVTFLGGNLILNDCLVKNL
jgi:hypothetical protein